jgi:quercetin 2,3-dioxygenase
MIKVRHAAERGKTKTNWLDSSHTFSFDRYYDPHYPGFRALLVINEDFVAPAQGFGTHFHDNMEILSYVIEGSLEHRDSTGASGVLRPDELQRMSAGTGVRHSEFNSSSTEPVHFLQIWISPEREGLSPEYEQRGFSQSEREGRLRLMASRGGRDGTVTIHQSVSLYDCSLKSGRQITQPLDTGRYAWVQVIEGSIGVNGAELQAGDGAALSEELSIEISARADSLFLLFDLE